MYAPYGNYYGAGVFTPNMSFSDFSLTYWERSLFQRMTALFTIDGLPEGGEGQIRWDKEAFLYGLFRRGFLVILESKTYGKVPLPGTPTGYGLQYQPIAMTITSPFFRFTEPLIIGRQCEVLKLTPDYRGIWDIITKCAQELQYMDVAIRQSSLNARFAYAVAAGNRNDADTAQAIFEKLANGETAIVYDPKFSMRKNQVTGELTLPWEQFDRNLKQNFVLPELLECRKTMLTDFYREIGIKIIPDKKERSITGEQEALDAEAFNRREVWNRCLQESVDQVNRSYGLDIRITVNMDEMERGLIGDTNT